MLNYMFLNIFPTMVSIPSHSHSPLYYHFDFSFHDMFFHLYNIQLWLSVNILEAMVVLQEKRFSIAQLFIIEDTKKLLFYKIRLDTHRLHYIQNVFIV